MTERTRTLQHMLGEMNLAAENAHTFLMDARNRHGFEVEHGDVFITTQEDVYKASRFARELRFSKPERSVGETTDEIRNAIESVGLLRDEIERQDGNIDRLDREVTERLKSALERAKGLENSAE